MLSFFLLQLKSNILFYGITAFLFILNGAGFVHYIYFGRYFTGHDIALFFVETEDTFSAFFDEFTRFGTVFLILGVFAALCILLRKLSNRFLWRSNWMSVPILICLAIIPIQNIKRGGEFSFPNNTQFMYFNALKSVSSYFVDIVAQSHQPKPFLPYQIELINTPGVPTTILYIMGEGINANHLSVFGYDRETTPYLKQWAKKDGFYQTIGVAGAVVTRNAISGFMNFQKEPENYTLVQSKRYNLFKLAKQAGFQTAFLSAQSFSSFPHVGLEYADKVFYRAQKGAAKIFGDDFWLTNLKELPLSDKNLIVVQMRAVHTPYFKTWRHRFDEFNHFSGASDQKTDAYDNGVLYVDSILNDVLIYANQIPGEVYVIFASDHNELFGEHGINGHVILHRAVARIPVFVWSNSPKKIQPLKNIQNPSHWDIGRQILHLMGYRVTNPNTPDDIVFIQGSDPTGGAGFITLKRVGDELIEQ